MKSLKTKHFSIASEIVEFVVENNIQREDILTITQGAGVGMNLFYYAEE